MMRFSLLLCAMKMADLNICKSPDGLTTLGLGSCVGIALRDPITKVGGLAHIMLPDSTAIKDNTNIPKFADTGILALIEELEKGYDADLIFLDEALNWKGTMISGKLLVEDL